MPLFSIPTQVPSNTNSRKYVISYYIWRAEGRNYTIYDKRVTLLIPAILAVFYLKDLIVVWRGDSKDFVVPSVLHEYLARQ